MEASKPLKSLTMMALIVLSLATYGSAKSRDDQSIMCGMTEQELFECKPAVASGTTMPPPPTAACCSALARADLACLCNFKNNKYLPYLGINATRAMQLPNICDPNQTAHC